MIRPPPILRPRLTRTYVLSSLVFLYVTYCFLTAQPFFSSNLPDYTGPHGVGAIDLEIPLSAPRTVHPATLKENGEGAFKMETVLFTLYYPAEPGVQSTKPEHLWIPKPIALTAQGYARFARIGNYFTNSLFTVAMTGLVGGRTIPAAVDVPLLRYKTQDIPLTVQPRDASSSSEEKGFPVMIFSHGMASSRTDYTHFAGELASRGHVVAAIEHRDGSGPGTVISKRGGSERWLLHFGEGDAVGVDGKSMSVDDFKEAQLAFREAEIEETVKIMQRINAGSGNEIFQSNSRDEGTDLQSWQGQLQTDRMLIGGHSYGATGALQALKRGPTESLPFHGCIALDPGKQSGRLNTDINVPLLVVHSNSWSSKKSMFFGRPHFSIVRELVEGVLEKGRKAWFMTSLGTSHPSVTDAPLLEPTILSWTTWTTLDVHEALRQYVHVCEDFWWYLRSGETRNLLGIGATDPEYGEDNSKMPEAFRPFWQIHVAPRVEDRF